MKNTAQLNVRAAPDVVVFVKRVSALGGVTQQQIVESAIRHMLGLNTPDVVRVKRKCNAAIRMFRLRIPN